LGIDLWEAWNGLVPAATFGASRQKKLVEAPVHGIVRDLCGNVLGVPFDQPQCELVWGERCACRSAAASSAGGGTAERRLDSAIASRGEARSTRPGAAGLIVGCEQAGFLA
jgi:hypothetical protein